MVFNMNKKKIIFLVIYVLLFILCLIDFPYYIDAPGGLDKVGKNIEIENAYDMDGSINLYMQNLIKIGLFVKRVKTILVH